MYTKVMANYYVRVGDHREMVTREFTDPQIIRHLLTFFPELTSDKKSNLVAGWKSKANFHFFQQDGQVVEVITDFEFWNARKGDLIKTKQKIMGAIQHEEQAEDAVDRSIDKLDDALEALGVE